MLGGTTTNPPADFTCTGRFGLRLALPSSLYRYQRWHPPLGVLVLNGVGPNRSTICRCTLGVPLSISTTETRDNRPVTIPTFAWGCLTIHFRMALSPGRRVHFVKLETRGFFPSSPPTGIGRRPARHRASAALAKAPRSSSLPSASLCVRGPCSARRFISYPQKARVRCLHWANQSVR
jgi:hypothetical protein